jgi:acyl transferase domain-containing protein
MGVGASDLLYPGQVGADASGCGAIRRLTEQEASEMLQDTRYSQPVLIALELCLAEVWRSQGLFPEAVLGHSLGEFAASVVAGVMSVEDCLWLVCERGRLMSELSSRTAAQGCMVAIRGTEAEAVESINRCGQSSSVSVGAVNGDKSIVLSGSRPGVMKVLAASVIMTFTLASSFTKRRTKEAIL